MEIKTRMVKISMGEYKRFRLLEKVDFDLIRSFERGLEDLRGGKVKRVK